MTCLQYPWRASEYLKQNRTEALRELVRVPGNRSLSRYRDRRHLLLPGRRTFGAKHRGKPRMALLVAGRFLLDVQVRNARRSIPQSSGNRRRPLAAKVSRPCRCTSADAKAPIRAFVPLDRSRYYCSRGGQGKKVDTGKPGFHISHHRCCIVWEADNARIPTASSAVPNR